MPEVNNAIEPVTENLPARTKHIRLAGKLWPIPPLPVRQQRVIVPKANALLRTVMPKMFMAERERAALMAEAAKRGPDAPPALPQTEEQFLQGMNIALATADFTQPQFDDLVDICVAAVGKLHPKVTREMMLDWDIVPAELVLALATISIQVNIIEGGKPTKTDEAPGETLAESPQTGTNTSTI